MYTVYNRYQKQNKYSITSFSVYYNTRFIIYYSFSLPPINYFSDTPVRTPILIIY